jgi:FtsP/CotA-like multicopper oxidase with cupredoxin domain
MAMTILALTVWGSVAQAQYVPVQPLLPATQNRFTLDLPVPIDYVPDRTTFPGFDYYEIQMSPVTPVTVAFPQGACPAGTQWLGLRVPPNTRRTPGLPMCTPVWGYSQVNAAGTYALNGSSTYPSMSFRALKGRPVKVKWINNTPDQHLFCPQPQNPNVPCAIDRTLMGTQGATNPFGSAQQPDNAMVVHLHGGEIPPDSDGMAELWFGNANSSAAYAAGGSVGPSVTGPVSGSQSGALQNIDPAFDTSTVAAGLTGASNGIEVGNLVRPAGNSAIYNYPMVQDAAPIWYHDHALGKTRINVAAGPAGFFFIEDPVKEKALGLPPRGDCSVAGVLKNAGVATKASACFDLPIAIQDRAFNIDGTINFPNGLGQVAPAGAVGWNPLTPGPNPTVHPQWVPEYFGDIPVVNGVIWPKVKVENRPYRFRLLDGSNARCYTLGLVTNQGNAPTFQVIGSDQGYLPRPANVRSITMCPGERYDVVIDFSRIQLGSKVTVTNTAAAPFPVGIAPAAGTAFAGMAQILQFQVVAADATNLPAVAARPAAWRAPTALVARTALVANAPARQMVLNEVLDPVSLFPLRVQIDGKRFEDAVTETPKRGSIETWTIVNTTVDAHPMHLHLVKFQVVSRQTFNLIGYQGVLGAVDAAANPQKFNLAAPVKPFLTGVARAALASEAGWKDTAISYPGEVLTVIARWDGDWADTGTGAPCTSGTLCNPAAATFTSTDPNAASATFGTPVAVTTPVIDPATGLQAIDPITALPVTAPVATPFWEPVTAGPYVWHCHIVDHEDNEMMRPLLVLPVGI